MMISFIYFRWRRSCSFTVFHRQACSICSICFNEVHQETQHSAKLSHFLTWDEKQHWGVKPLSRETWNEHTAQCQPSSARIRPNWFFTEISPLQNCSSAISLPKSPITCTLMSSRVTCVWTTLNCLVGVLPLKFERFWKILWKILWKCLSARVRFSQLPGLGQFWNLFEFSSHLHLFRLEFRHRNPVHKMEYDGCYLFRLSWTPNSLCFNCFAPSQLRICNMINMVLYKG